MNKITILNILSKLCRKYKIKILVNFCYHPTYLAFVQFSKKETIINFNLKFKKQFTKHIILHEFGHAINKLSHNTYNEAFISEYFAEKFALENLNKKQYKKAISLNIHNINSDLWKKEFNIHRHSFTQLLVDKGELYEYNSNTSGR